MELFIKILSLLPAYFANSTPTLLGGYADLDSIFGKKIFGKHKTLPGVLSALLSSILISFLLFSYIIPILNLKNSFMFGILCGAGVVIGDLTGSFIKRRMGMKEGEKFLLDNFLFIIFALLLGYSYFVNVFKFTLVEFLLVIILSSLLHALFNKLAYHLGIKKVWW